MRKIAVLTILFLITIALYFEWSTTFSVAIGLFWGSLNLYFIRELLCEVLVANPKNYGKICLLTLLKFPLLYAIGYALLLIDQISPGSCLIGFIIVIASSTQKWFWLPLTQIKSRQPSS